MPGRDVVQQMRGASNLTVRFATDDQSLAATETNSYQLTTGESVIYMRDWQGTRQN